MKNITVNDFISLLANYYIIDITLYDETNHPVPLNWYLDSEISSIEIIDTNNIHIRIEKSNTEIEREE